MPPGPSVDLNRIRDAQAGICRDIGATLLPAKAAAWANGIPERSFMRYLARGRAAHDELQNALDAGQKPPEENETIQVLRELFEAVQCAIGEGTRARLARVVQGKAGWQGSAWTLERSPWTRKDLSPPTRVEFSGPDGGPLHTLQVVVSQRNQIRSELGMPPLEIEDRK